MKHQKLNSKNIRLFYDIANKVNQKGETQVADFVTLDSRELGDGLGWELKETNLGKQTIIAREPQIFLGVSIVSKQTYL